MQSATPLATISRQIEEAVERIPLPASSRHFAAIPLRQPGKALAGATRPLWPSTVLAACAAAGGDLRIGEKIAAAVEIFMAGLDVLDEVEDGDASPLVEAVGVPQALNIATALLFLSQRLVCDLGDDGLPPARTLLLAQTLADAGLTATGGQHRDLLSTQERTESYDDAIETARQKAGALVAGACQMGAAIGTDNGEILALYHAWGLHYGTAAQLSNDLHDAEDAEEKSDIAQQKGTLPLIFHQATPAEPTEVSNPQASGALHFTWVILEIERQRCAAIADELAERGQDSQHLRTLLGAV